MRHAASARRTPWDRARPASGALHDRRKRLARETIGRASLAIQPHEQRTRRGAPVLQPGLIGTHGTSRHMRPRVHSQLTATATLILLLAPTLAHADNQPLLHHAHVGEIEGREIRAAQARREAKQQHARIARTRSRLAIESPEHTTQLRRQNRGLRLGLQPNLARQAA